MDGSGQFIVAVGGVDGALKVVRGLLPGVVRELVGAGRGDVCVHGQDVDFERCRLQADGQRHGVDAGRGEGVRGRRAGTGRAVAELPGRRRGVAEAVRREGYGERGHADDAARLDEAVARRIEERSVDFVRAGNVRALEFAVRDGHGRINGDDGRAGDGVQVLDDGRAGDGTCGLAEGPAA